MPDFKVVCPLARLVDTDPGNPKLVCGPMEADQERVDRILEGSHVGVVVSARADPSTFFGLCCGTGDPTVDPVASPSMHYTSCPVFVTSRDWDEAQRLFGSGRRGEEPREPGLDVGPQPVTVEDLRRIASGAAG